MMNRKTIFNLMLGLGAGIINQQVMAATYTYPANSNSALAQGSSTIFNTISPIYQDGSGNWLADLSPTGVMGIAYDYRFAIPGKIITPDYIYNQYGNFCKTGAGINVNYNVPFNLGFFKLRGTNSDFVNQNGLIKFNISEERGPIRREGDFQSRDCYALGIRDNSNKTTDSRIVIHNVLLAFMKPPLKAEIVDIKILETDYTITGVEPYTLQPFVIKSAQPNAGIHLRIIITPNLSKTCDVSNQTVNLPPMLAGDIKAGVAAGATQFNVTATCDVTLLGKTAYFTLADNSFPGGVDHDVIYFSGDKAALGGIELTDTSGALIKPNTENVFGTKLAAQTTVSKTLVASYKFNTDSPPPGKYGAQATILVAYK
ncbi:fimbrial protein [Acinetobacter calcoaceticus]|uniref:fimbrial protein n=1 Tax=Acinetobacter calcoaceticus TaxID=471 RepID=UPI00192C9A8D|nr:fimbrial protein [Acinetobacter calcoaceticus]